MLRNVGKRLMLSGACASALLLGAAMPLTSYAHSAQTTWEGCGKKECPRPHKNKTLLFDKNQGTTASLAPGQSAIVLEKDVPDEDLGKVVFAHGDAVFEPLVVLHTLHDDEELTFTGQRIATCKLL